MTQTATDSDLAYNLAQKLSALAVSQIRQRLGLPFHGEIDSDFVDALKKFQEKNHLKMTGRLDARTKRKLQSAEITTSPDIKPTLSESEKKQAIKINREILNSQQIKDLHELLDLEIDEINTSSIIAIARWQIEHHEPVTGIARGKIAEHLEKVATSSTVGISAKDKDIFDSVSEILNQGESKSAQRDRHNADEESNTNKESPEDTDISEENASLSSTEDPDPPPAKTQQKAKKENKSTKSKKTKKRKRKSSKR